MTYSILQISAAAYKDIRDRLTALDARLRIGPEYETAYIKPGETERLVFGDVAFEALPEEANAAVAELRDRLGELVLSVGALAEAMPDSVILEHEGLVNRVTAAAERLSHAEIEAILDGALEPEAPPSPT